MDLGDLGGSWAEALEDVLGAEQHEAIAVPSYQLAPRGRGRPKGSRNRAVGGLALGLGPDLAIDQSGEQQGQDIAVRPQRAQPLALPAAQLPVAKAECSYGNPALLVI